MALTGWSGTAYLDLAAAIGNYPIKFSAWGYVDDYTSVDEYTAVSLGIAGSSNQRRAVLTNTGALSGLGNRVRALVRTTGNSFATATSDSPTDTWYHLSGNFISTTSREALMNAANKGTNTTSRDPSAPSRTRIGVRPDLNDPLGSTDGLAEISVWDLTGFTGTDYDDLDVKLAAGEVPTDIDAEVGEPWTGKLLAYWPLADTTDLADASGNGNTLTMVGTLTNFASHPPVGATASAAITGTATASIDEADIVAGGKTIIITLTNDTWVASGATFDAQRQAIIDGLDSAQSEATGWNAEVRDNLAVTTVVRTSDTVVTITLSAQAAYDITAQETITVTVPSTAVTGAAAITGSPTFTVDPVVVGSTQPPRSMHQFRLMRAA